MKKRNTKQSIIYDYRKNMYLTITRALERDNKNMIYRQSLRLAITLENKLLFYYFDVYYFDEIVSISRHTVYIESTLNVIFHEKNKIT